MTEHCDLNHAPIGVFDSGVGGLTVAREIMRQIPDERIVYFGDTARVPYGSKSPNTIIRYSRQIIRFLRTKNVKAIVVACNTASAFALETIKPELDIPIIGVSAKTDIDSKVNLIRNGADDYITKPFDNQELLVRIEAVLRRFQKSTGPNNGKMLHFKDLSLDTEAMEAKIGNTPIALTRYEYLILQLLMSAPSKVFTKNNIFESVWNEDFIGDDNAINVHIGNLRKKFAKVNPEEKYIQTVWGLGFKMQG